MKQRGETAAPVTGPHFAPLRSKVVVREGLVFTFIVLAPPDPHPPTLRFGESEAVRTPANHPLCRSLAVPKPHARELVAKLKVTSTFHKLKCFIIAGNGSRYR